MRHRLPALMLAGFLFAGCAGEHPVLDNPLATPTLSFAPEQTPDEPDGVIRFHSLPPDQIDLGIEELQVQASAAGFTVEKLDFPQSIPTGQAQLEMWSGVNDNNVQVLIEVGYDNITMYLSEIGQPTDQPPGAVQIN